MKNYVKKICFAVLVHNDRELVKQLIDNINLHCPNSMIVLYNGGNDPTLLDGLNVPVCPTSRKLNYGYTTIYFLEVMEWLAKIEVNYDYFINLDSDVLFYRKGYEEFVVREMKKVDYMAVNLREPDQYWEVGIAFKQDSNRWAKFFNVQSFLGVFNVAQIMSKRLVQALLNYDKKNLLKKAMIDTTAWGADEIAFVNLVKELGFRYKGYPTTESKTIRYRPYFTINELTSAIHQNKNSWLCHPIHRNIDDPAREFITNLYSHSNSNKKICFAVLVHENKEIVKELIENIRHFCPNSIIVLYNGGDDPNLVLDLDIPVCPTSKKISYGNLAMYFIEMMEWLESIEIEYEYFINIDSDALFIQEGYEQFIDREMKNTELMAVDFRLVDEDYFCWQEFKKVQEKWKSLLNTETVYGAFNVGQVMRRSFIKALLKWEKTNHLKQLLNDSPPFGIEELLFVNLAKKLGFTVKSYPSNIKKTSYHTIGWDMYQLLIRYRPHITITELIESLNSHKEIYLCHPVYRRKKDATRQFIYTLQNLCLTSPSHTNKTFLKEKNKTDNCTSNLIKSQFGNQEVVVQSKNNLTHFYQARNGEWYETEVFANDVKGTPLLYESRYGNFEVIAPLEKGGIAHWWRNNKSHKKPWNRSTVITTEEVLPILLTQLDTGELIFIGILEEKLALWTRNDGTTWQWERSL